MTLLDGLSQTMIQHSRRQYQLIAATKQAGFTLIELMIVIVIMGILIGVAAPRMASVVANNAAKEAIQLLQLDMSFARNLAITHGSVIRVVPVGGEYENGWEIRELTPDDVINGGAGELIRSRSALDDKVNISSNSFNTATPIGYTSDGLIELAGTLQIRTDGCKGLENHDVQLFVSGQIMTTEVACQ